MSDLPKKTIKITDLERLDTPVKIDGKQELLMPMASNQSQKDTFSVPVNSFVEWLLLKHASDKDLSNLSDAGQAVLKAKQDYFYNVPDDTDLNTFTDDGIYKVKSTGDVDIHAPTNAAGYYVVATDSDNGDVIEQQARNLYIAPGIIYRRQRINGTWTRWEAITMDITSPSFNIAPTVLQAGTNDDQLATIGQLNGKFSDVFKTEYHITEGLLVDGSVVYADGILTVENGSRFITNDSNDITLTESKTASVDAGYAFIGTDGIKVWNTLSKVAELPTVMQAGVLYYNIISDTYTDLQGSYSLAPLGIVANGAFTQSAGVQFVNTTNLQAVIDSMRTNGAVESFIGTREQNSIVSSDNGYEREISAGSYVNEEELSFGAGVAVRSHTENDNDEWEKNTTAEIYAKDGSNETRIAITPESAKLVTPRLDSESEIATMADLDEIKQTSLTFIGYVSTSTPTGYTFKIGNKWINASKMPTAFPITGVKTWNGSAWVADDDFTPVDFDFFRNINDNEGYYWFGGAWKIMSTDMDTDYFVLGNDGKWKIKESVNLTGSPTLTTSPLQNDNSKKIATTEFVQSAIASHSDDNVVHKTGDETIRGIKTFESPFTILKSTDIDWAEIPTSDRYAGLEIRDKNGKRIGKLEQYQNKNTGEIRLALNVSGYDASGTINYSPALGVSINKDGTGGKTYASLAAASSNDNSIATTAWFNNKMQVVSSLPANPDANTFYFVKE